MKENVSLISMAAYIETQQWNGKMPMDTNSISTVAPLLLTSFDKTDHRLLYRRLASVQKEFALTAVSSTEYVHRL